MKNLAIYQNLNKAKYYREFKNFYHVPNMKITSYRRVLYGESTYLRKGHSPYIADILRYISNKLNKPYIEVAYDLLDSEYFGKKNTLLDVFLAETGLDETLASDFIGKEYVQSLDNIRLCDLNSDNRRIYDEAIKRRFHL